MKKPIEIIRKDDGEIYEIQPEGTYVNVRSKEMGSIMTWNLYLYKFLNKV